MAFRGGLYYTFFSPNTLPVFHRLRRGRHKAMLGLGSWGMNFDNYFGVDVTTRSRVNKRLGTRLVEGLVWYSSIGNASPPQSVRGQVMFMNHLLAGSERHCLVVRSMCTRLRSGSWSRRVRPPKDNRTGTGLLEFVSQRTRKIWEENEYRGRWAVSMSWIVWTCWVVADTSSMFKPTWLNQGKFSWVHLFLFFI